MALVFNMSLGWLEICFLALLGLVIFGEDLPKVSRDAGKLFYRARNFLRETFDI